MINNDKELLLILYCGVWVNISLWKQESTDSLWHCTEAFGDIRPQLLGKTADIVSRIVKDNQWDYQWIKPDEIKDIELCKD